ncbi:hypothetical protein COB11_04995 [Candidatus Aerophobetes bacterium]|uniref:NodB homology domain-containing protein n=1 Tax=Aerophobetes bacterium TaxID=2030807 RepID=A0A2A4YFM1_UNCAE|nr:MAG: hypothetical protein COB11_04995 [Candidatus Aerophobetes bacterium]
MLITLLYHRAFECPYGNTLDSLEKHFIYLKKHANIVLPFEELKKHALNVCISFDDATFDFYEYVYPLLKKHQIKALLSVPTGFISASETITPETRISELKRFPNNSTNASCYCSFSEIAEMSTSGFVDIASHGVDHVNLTSKGIDLEKEIRNSKETLESALNKKIECFVYPYGRFNKQIHEIVKKYYKLGMRIGNGVNFSWDSSLHFRINADGIKKVASLLGARRRVLGGLKSIKRFYY